jgi:hypothetical protein
MESSMLSCFLPLAEQIRNRPVSHDPLDSQCNQSKEMVSMFGLLQLTRLNFAPDGKDTRTIGDLLEMTDDSILQLDEIPVDEADIFDYDALDPFERYDLGASTQHLRLIS